MGLGEVTTCAYTSLVFLQCFDVIEKLGEGSFGEVSVMMEGCGGGGGRQRGVGGGGQRDEDKNKDVLS